MPLFGRTASAVRPNTRCAQRMQLAPFTETRRFPWYPRPRAATSSGADCPVTKRTRLHILSAGAVFLLMAGALLARAEATHATTARERAPGFACPGAPEGWTASASNPQVFGPAQQPGQQHTSVTCDYSKPPTHA